MKRVSAMALLSLMGFVSAISMTAAAELAGKVDGFVKAFNAEAGTLGVGAILIQTDCDDGPSKTCKFSAANGMAGFVQARGASESPSMVMLAKGNADGSDFILSVGVMMAMFAPDVNVDERGAALTHMLTKLTKEGVSGTADLDSAKFTLSHNQGTGVVAFVEALE